MKQSKVIDLGFVNLEKIQAALDAEAATGWEPLQLIGHASSTWLILQRESPVLPPGLRGPKKPEQ